jgi:D-alanyl-D-alanine carboxypeptidase/D-alanyl-D-alanine-endopeptidase (penicillin-binding protein 4)
MITGAVKLIHSSAMHRRTVVQGIAAGLGLSLLRTRSSVADILPKSAIPEMAKFGFADDQVGFVVLDPSTGEALDAHNPNALFIPASVAKLATVYPAWRVLGADFHFHTRLYHTDGTLYLQGGGDPVLTAVDMRRALSAIPIKSLPKWQAFVYDAGLIAHRSEVNPTQPVAAVYNAGFGALNVDFNRIQVSWSRKAGGIVVFRARAVADGLNVPADWITFSPATDDLPPGANFVYAGDETGQRWVYPRGLPASLEDDGALFLPVKDAAGNTIQVFRRIAQIMGFALPPAVPGIVPAGAALVGEIPSKTFPEIVTGLLKFSNNMTAELIGLNLSRQLTGQTVETAQSAGLTMDWLRKNLPQADWQGFNLVNHSGLSTENRASPLQIASILAAMAQDPALVATLAKDGKGGAKAATAAKSGTMDFAGGLAGFFTASSGRRLAFAIFGIDAARRTKLDQTADARVLAPTPGSRTWTGRLHALEDAMISRWHHTL